MDPKELLRSRNRFDETLPSGLRVTIRRPHIRDCIIAGRVPMPIIEYVQSVAKSGGNGQVPELSPEMKMEDAAATARFHDEIVRCSVVAIEGEPIELATEDVREFLQEDYDRIVELGTRSVPLVASPQ
jgi:hypothetical protein